MDEINPDILDRAIPELEPRRRATSPWDNRSSSMISKPTTWPEPQPLPAGLPSVPALSDLLLPESIRGWIVDIAERAQAPLDFPAAGAIVALSSAIGRRVGMRPKRQDDWTVVPNLWGLIIGPPAFLKSPMLHEILKPLSRLEAEARDEHKAALAEHELKAEALAAERKKILARAIRPKASASREEVINELRELHADAPVERRYIVNDPTVEKLGEILNQNPPGVLLFRDEIFGFLATMDRSGHENDRAFYLEAWNGTGDYTYDRIVRGTLHIEAACVSILGGITPGPLSAYLRETFSGVRDDGLIQRFQLAVYPDPPRDWRNVDRLPDTKAKARAFEVFKRLVEHDESFVSSVSDPQAGEIPTLRFDDEAQDFFDAWRGNLEARIREADEHPVIQAHLAKYRSLLPSLALIFHMSDCASGGLGHVGLEQAKRAAAWCDYLEAHARRIYHCVTARIDTTVRLLGAKIQTRKLPSPFTARVVYRQQWTGLNDPEDVGRALEALEDLGWVVAERRAHDATGGRPAITFRVNPRIWEPR